VSEAAWTAAEFESRLRERGRAYHNIPLKDAAILANWLAAAVGLARAEVESLALLLPGVRFAVDAYVNFARRAPWPEAVCASLTELFAPQIHRERVAGWPQHYPWIERGGLGYFQARIGRAPRDVEFALAVTLERFDTRAAQERALEVLKFKLDILWQMNDALALAYGVTP